MPGSGPGNDVLRGYAVASADLIARFEDVSPTQLYAPVADLLPLSPSTIADIGAGTGRDAAWLAAAGHDVIAVEPVEELRRAARALHPSPRIEWLNDSLPDLQEIKDRKLRFDRVLLSAVWQHLGADRRGIALRSLADVTAPGGMVIMSLRHGPGALDRPVQEARPDETIQAARGLGFQLIRERKAGSLQARNRAAGVHWTWLAFGMP